MHLLSNDELRCEKTVIRRWQGQVKRPQFVPTVIGKLPAAGIKRPP
jgi:hypothetical protein